MDSLHAIGFYVSATLSLGGALLVAFLPTRNGRGLALAATGLGIAGIYVSLSAGLAALVVLVCYAAIALLLAGRSYRTYELSIRASWRQLGALGAAGLFAMLAFAAFRGDFVHAPFVGGPFGSAAVGRFLLDHDALATEAIGALVLVALVGATAAWRARERGR
jgi:NADH:ubiquinone oxidoreductase subunit 6 (subunit J)